MGALSAARWLGDRAIASVQFLLASALGLLLFLMLANLVVVQYGRGAVQSALDQAARAGSITRTEKVCEQKAAEVINHLLGGEMGDSVRPICSISDGVVVARASAVFPSWIPLQPDFRSEMVARATTEPRP